MDISILRRRPEDRIRPIRPFDGDDTTIDVLFAGREEMQQVKDVARALQLEGRSSEDAFNLAYGRVLVRGWKGLTDGGEPLPFSVENCDLLMLGSAEIRLAVIAGATSLKAGAEKN